MAIIIIIIIIIIISIIIVIIFNNVELFKDNFIIIIMNCSSPSGIHNFNDNNKKYIFACFILLLFHFINSGGDDMNMNSFNI